jgi:hypothetical protein
VCEISALVGLFLSFYFSRHFSGLEIWQGYT